MKKLSYESTPLVNFDLKDEELELISNQTILLMKAPRSSQMKPVEWVKSKIGKQSYTWQGSEFRFWVWENCDYRLFVNNAKGICFEIRADASSKEALNIWNDFIKIIENSG